MATLLHLYHFPGFYIYQIEKDIKKPWFLTTETLKIRRQLAVTHCEEYPGNAFEVDFRDGTTLFCDTKGNARYGNQKLESLNLKDDMANRIIFYHKK